MTPGVERFPDQSKKVAVVTGANSGLGWHTALGLASAGARVVLACRNADRGRDAIAGIQREVPHASLDLMALDLASLSNISNFARSYRDRFDRLDLLVNNAGVMFPPRTLTVDGFELQFGVNHLGHFALTAQLVQLVQNTPGARIVTVSSAFHWLGQLDLDDVRAECGYSRVGAYARSKLCNLLFAFELSRRLEAASGHGMSVATHPGLSRSNLAMHSVLAGIGTKIFGQSARQGAWPTLHAAMQPKVRAGDFYGPALIAWGSPRRALCSPSASSSELASKLWIASEQLTGEKFELDHDATA